MPAPEPPASVARRQPPRRASGVAVLVVLDRPLVAGDVPVLLDRIRRDITAAAGPFVACDVGRIVAPDMRTVDALARLALGVRRCGSRLLLQRATPELRDLLRLAGLDCVLPCAPLPLQPFGQAEEREEAGGVEEERDPGDPAV